MSTEYVVVCADVDPSNGSCIGETTYMAYLLPPEAGPQSEMFLTGGFDSEVAALGFTAMLTLWVAGFGIGLIINVVRKMRN